MVVGSQLTAPPAWERAAARSGPPWRPLLSARLGKRHAARAYRGVGSPRAPATAPLSYPPHPSLVAARALPALVPIFLGALRPAQPPLWLNSHAEKTNARGASNLLHSLAKKTRVRNLLKVFCSAGGAVAGGTVWHPGLYSGSVDFEAIHTYFPMGWSMRQKKGTKVPER